MRGWGRVLTAALVAEFAALCGAFSAAAQERPQTAIACTGETIARGSASRVIDGRTFVLDDGREVRLAAIEVPPLPLPQESGAAPGGVAAKDALVSLFTRAEVVLRQAGTAKNRSLWTRCRLRLRRARRCRAFGAGGVDFGRCRACRRPGPQPELCRGTLDARKRRAPGQAWPLGQSVL